MQKDVAFFSKRRWWLACPGSIAEGPRSMVGLRKPSVGKVPDFGSEAACKGKVKEKNILGTRRLRIRFTKERTEEKGNTAMRESGNPLVTNGVRRRREAAFL